MVDGNTLHQLRNTSQPTTLAADEEARQVPRDEVHFTLEEQHN